MSAAIDELHERISCAVASLPPEKKRAVLDFVAQLRVQSVPPPPADENPDAAWERLLNDSRARPKLQAFMDAALAEGSEPLDPGRF
jgi:hypothetical protein